MSSDSRRAVMRRRLLIGLAVGLSVAVFDFFVFFCIPSVREPTHWMLSNSMEPLLLATPAALAGVCLVAWVLTFIFPDRH